MANRVFFYRERISAILYGMRLLRLLLLMAMLSGISLTCYAQAIVGEMFASDASVHGSIRFASGGTEIQSGSSLTAGDAAAVLRLRRGGNVRICPRTTVSVAVSPNGRDILWGMNTGAMEADFTLSASADTVMTPDFRILLSGPGTFHFAISADVKGDTCVRPLAHNTAALIVSDLNGDGTYQVQPSVQVLFRNGKIADATSMVPPSCGCPRLEEPVQQVAQEQPQPRPTPVSTPATTNQPPLLLPVPDRRNLPAPTVSSELTHLQMEAPFVYRAGNQEQELSRVAARLRLTSGAEFPDATVLPPLAGKAEPSQAAAHAETHKRNVNRGLLSKLGSFFARIFK